MHTAGPRARERAALPPAPPLKPCRTRRRRTLRASRLQRPASSAGSSAWHTSRAAATSGASSALATTASNSSPKTTAADARARARRARAPRGERARRATPGAPPMPRLAAMLPRDRQPRRARATRALRDHTHTQRAALPHTQRLRTPQALVPLPHPRHVTRDISQEIIRGADVVAPSDGARARRGGCGHAIERTRRTVRHKEAPRAARPQRSRWAASNLTFQVLPDDSHTFLLRVPCRDSPREGGVFQRLDPSSTSAARA